MALFRFGAAACTALLPALFFLAPETTAPRPADNPDRKAAYLLQTIVQGLSGAHYQPAALDDAFSRRVFGLYLKRLDAGKKFLRQPDVQELQAFQRDIDNEIQRGSQEFLQRSTALMTARVQEAQLLYRELLAKPFDFTAKETFETDAEKLDYAATPTAQRERWRLLLKYQTLARLSELLDEQNGTDKSLASTKVKPSPATMSKPVRPMSELEAEARKQVLKYYDDTFANLLQTDAQDRLAQFANTVANVYDPHTEYFAPRDKDNFDIALTGRFEGTGAQLGEQDNKIVVTDIVPGSASYRQGELKIGDEILRVAQGAAEPVAVGGMRFDKIVQMIRGKKGSEVRLTVKKPDGTVRVIPIIRDVVVLEETYAQSATVQQDGKKYGYIHLPAFYADFNNNGGRSSAEDVKAELAKLKQQNVQGVVLDLRFNGGGSLQDAVDMAGLFVSSGPMVQVKSAQRPAQVLNDSDTRVQYEGPLVVLVNKYSASASEILAAAIQDHQRGIIMGNTTYGKGTVQRVFDLDEVLPAQFNSLKPFGSLKITLQKYYRIGGGSTQFRGVTPDVTLPDAYSALGTGEQQTDFPLGWDEIGAAPFRTWQAPVGLRQLAEASRRRVATDAGFRLIGESVQELVKRQKLTQVSLNLDAYRADQQQARAVSERFKEAQQLAPALEVAPTLAAATTDSTLVQRGKRFVKPLGKDLALREAVAVLADAR
ncbi:carboxy terminal-processing peptidase [Hymenobacter sp. B81]|uniref:carboxy terminal-processing peptidase n=1 Tax=Hymenobacter sp. B81 TaxID=3344878 RepID=UPI0037DD329C